MFRKAFGRSDLPLSDYELQLRRQKQRKLAIIAGAILLLLLAGYFSARPVVNVVRGWQARRHAEKAFAFIEQQQWGPARDEAIAAYRLRATEPQAIRAVARLFSRAGQPDGLAFWKELRNLEPLTRADLRDEAELALKTRELGLGDEAVKELLSNREGGPTASDWLLAAQLAVQQQDLDRASMQIRKIFAGTDASARDRFQATLLLDTILRGKEAPDQSEVIDRLAGFARGKDSVALDALVLLGQRILSAPATATPPAAISIDEIINALEKHPLAKAQHKLLAIDLKIREHPDQRDALVQDAIAQWKGSDNVSLLALAAWLNSHGEYQRELDAVPRQRAMQTRELFFQHVDALGALGRWDEIRRLIESEQFPLDPVMEHMYLARCFAQQGQTSGAENNWGRAMQAAAGDPSKLMTLADYAEKNGVYDVAAGAFEATVAVAPKLRVAQQGRLRVAYAQRDTKKIHDILVDLLKIWPGDTAVQNDEAYSRLLLLPADADPAELKAIETLAEKLLEQERSSLPHRTVLALARLKQNRPNEALEVYKNINVPKSSLTTSSVVIHSAVLAANGHADEAKAEFSHIPVDKILPEERALAPQ